MSTRFSKPSSIAQVAELCGVHKSTVSRVLNNRYPKGFSVSAEVRARVERVAAELNFRPNPVLRTMSAERTGLIALLGLSDFNRSSRGPLEDAINVMLQEFRDLEYRICTSFLTVGDEAYAPPPWRVDGAIVLNPTLPEHYESIESSGIPYIVMNGVARPDRPSVQVDDFGGAKMAADHMLGLGHRRIAYLKTQQFGNAFRRDKDGRLVLHPSVSDRQRGYLASMKQAGLEPIPGHDQWETPLPIAVERAVSHGATAFLCYDHVEAVEIMGRLQRSGLRVPTDVSVLCFNEAFPTAEIFPSLTAMVVPGDEMALAAVRLLSQVMRGEAVEQAVVREKLRPRESTGPVSSRALNR